MNECDELIPVTESRKRRRSFRYSSRRVLDRSRLKRLTKARGCELTSVTRTLSYPSLIEGEVCASKGPSFQSPGFVPVEISEEGRKETSNADHIKDSDYHKTCEDCKLLGRLLLRGLERGAPLELVWSSGLLVCKWGSWVLDRELGSASRCI